MKLRCIAAGHQPPPERYASHEFGLRVTQNFFDTLGVAPRFGRNFTATKIAPLAGTLSF